MSARKPATRPGNPQIQNSGQVTLEDVAKLAGVSPATVSRCLNDPLSVRTEKREKVSQAINALDYVPHGAARALASRRTGMIGAVFPSLDSSLFGGMLEAMQSEVSKSGYTLVVSSSGYDIVEEYRNVRNLLARGVDAITLVGGIHDPLTFRLIDNMQLPYVLTWVKGNRNRRPTIGFDNFDAMKQMTRHLIELGHRRFGYITGYLKHNDRTRARLNGFKKALQSAKINFDPGNLVETTFGIEEGRIAARQLLSQDSKLTAIVCGSDMFAYGVIHECIELGLSIPDDLSITGFDDMEMSRHIHPGLTTIRTPRDKIGLEVGRFFLSILDGGNPKPPATLPVELILRGSTAAP